MKMVTERLKFADIFPDKAASVAQRLHIKKDEIPFVRKYYTAEKDKTEIKKKERAIISYISTGIKDRDGEKLLPEGALLENYQKNPIVPFAHDYRTVPPAKNMWIKKDEKGLIAKTVFAKNQRADEYYQAYTEDVGGTGPLLNAFSVGFIPLEWEDTDKKAMEKDPDLPRRIYKKWELLEYSLVPIPSCHEALTIAIEKGLISERLKKDLEIEVVKDKKDRVIEVECEECEDREIEVVKDEYKEVKESIKKLDASFDALKEIDIDIEEAQKDIDELLVIDGESATWGKVKRLTGKYKLKLEDGHFSLSDAVRAFEKKYGLSVSFDKEGKVVITKPETIGKYHHIPVNPTCKITATITISASQGIKATYCGAVKKVHTYLFDVKKWTMEEAKKWVAEHKEFTEALSRQLEVEEEAILVDDVLDALEEKEVLRSDVSDEPEEGKGMGIGIQVTPELWESMKTEMQTNRIVFDVLKNKIEELVDIKEGRVLSRKNRKIVKDAVTALNAVLKADATGSREDEESEAGTVTERTVEIEREGEREFSKEDIAKVVKEVSGEQMGEILKGAFEKALNPEKMKAMVSEGIKLELDKLRGKVT